MKARGTVWWGFLSLVFAAGFGIFLVMATTGVWTQKGEHAFVGAVLCGVFALVAFDLSRLEDDEDGLSKREKAARKTYEKVIADVERRRKALS